MFAAEHYDVFPCNWDTVSLFIHCEMQWNYHPVSGQRSGMDLADVMAIGALMFDASRLIELWEGIRVMVTAILEEQQKS